MKFFLISLLATIGVFVAFFFGLLSQQMVIAMVSFCSSYMALFMLGLSVGKSGKLRSPIVFSDDTPTAYSTSTLTPITPRQSRLSPSPKKGI